MPLIDDFDNAGDGEQLTYDITTRRVNGGEDVRITDVREWKGLTLGAARLKALVDVNKAPSTGATGEFGFSMVQEYISSSLSSFLMMYERSVQFSISLDSNVINSYILTRTIDISSVVVGGSLSGYYINEFSPAPQAYDPEDWPVTVRISRTTGSGTPVLWYAVRPIFGESGGTVITNSTSSSYVDVSLTGPSIVIAHATLAINADVRAARAAHIGVYTETE